jgi:restriction endonuclease S subunit
MNKYEIWNEVSELEEAIRHITSAIEWKKETLRRLQQWGLSDDVFLLTPIQEYIKQFKWNCLWYIWRERSKKDDVFLEKNWGWSKSELAKFCCSKSSRYYSEEEKKTRDLVKKYYLSFKSEE